MKKFILALTILTGCFSKPSNELEQMGDDVLKSKRDEGLEIEIKPIPKASACDDRPTPPKPDEPPGIVIITIPFYC